MSLGTARHGAGRLNLSPLGAGSELLCSITVTVHINIVLCAQLLARSVTSHTNGWQVQLSLPPDLTTDKSGRIFVTSVPRCRNSYENKH